jgi:glycogen(starch) synthase
MTADAVGGVWNYALGLCSALGTHDIEVLLAVVGPSASNVQRQEAGVLPNLQLVECDGKLEWMERPWEDVNRSGEWLLELEQCWKPDVIHLNSYAYGALPWCAPRLLVGHSCVFSWWEAVHGTRPSSEWSVYRERVERGLQGANLVIAPTRAMLDALRRYYRWDHLGIVIPNAASSCAYAPPQKLPLVFAVGRIWDAAKNLIMLDRIASQLKWPVLMAGESFFGDEGVTTAHIRSLGQLPTAEVRSMMNAAGIYALPAKYEPFGLAILEAALSGCALVLGDISSLRELWNEAAVFVSPDDPDQLLRAITHFIDCPRERSRYGTLARLRAAQYQPPKMADRYMSAYRRLL